MEKRILFLDLDGTLLDDEKNISPGNRAALERALRAGHRVVIATGRALSSARIQAELLGLTGPGCFVAAYNGAVVYDWGREEIVLSQPLDMEAFSVLVEEADRRGIFLQTYDGDDVVVEPRNDNETVRRYCSLSRMHHRVVSDLRRDLREAPPKALIADFDQREPLEEMQKWIRDNLYGQMDCFFSSPYYLEVVRKGLNKGQAVIEMCRRLDVPISNAIAVGDEANDLSMIRSAGIGVAMANGIDEVKAAADYVTQRDNNHDGVAEVVERFCFGTEE